jgi:hypothetical protein
MATTPQQAPSRFEYRVEHLIGSNADEIERQLCELGAAGWRLILVAGPLFYLERPVENVAGGRPLRKDG